MSIKDFIPFGNESVTVEFKCPKCDAKLVSESLSIPSSNLIGDNNEQSTNCGETESINCNCGFEADVTVCVSNNGGYIDFSEEIDEDSVEITLTPKEE